MNAVEREPVPTRVLNPNASEVSYKPKQRSYRKTNLKKKFWRPIVPAPKGRCRIGVVESYPTLERVGSTCNKPAALVTSRVNVG